MFASLWRAPAAGVRLSNRSSWAAVSSMPSAAVFSSTRDTRFVPGIGAMSFPWASNQASRRSAHLSGHGRHLGDDAQVALEVLPGESRVGLAPVVVGEIVDGADLAGEKAVTEWRVWNEPDS